MRRPARRPTSARAPRSTARPSDGSAAKTTRTSTWTWTTSPSTERPTTCEHAHNNTPSQEWRHASIGQSSSFRPHALTTLALLRLPGTHEEIEQNINLKHDLMEMDSVPRLLVCFLVFSSPMYLNLATILETASYCEACVSR